MLTIYDGYGGTAQCELNRAQDIVITDEINGEHSLSFTLPYDDTKSRYLTQNYLVHSSYNRQYYRINKVTTATGNPPSISVFCRHIYFDSEKLFVSSMEAEIGQYANVIFADIWADTGYTVLTDSQATARGMTNVSTYTDFGEQNKTTPAKLTDQLIESISQGELYIDNKTIALVSEIGANYDTLVLDITKNMDSITIDEDSSELITRLYPFGKDNRDLTSDYGVMYVDSPNISEYGVLEGYVDYSQITDITMLHARATWAFDVNNQNRIDKPYVTISGRFVDMTDIKERFQKPHLGQKVSVKGYTGQRIIKIVQKPLTPYDTEITIGKVKKDLFYYFRYFNNSVDDYNAKGKNPSQSTELQNTIVEVTQQAVVAADVMNATSAFIDDLQVERLQTNVKNFIVEPNLTVINNVVSWTGGTKTWRARSNANVRGYIKMEGLTQTFIEAHLTTPSSYTAMTASDITAFTVNGRQLYFTTISGTQAFQYLTFVAPETKYNGLTNDQREMYKVYMRKASAEYVKMKQEFEWNVTDQTYYVRSTYGTGDTNGNGVYYFYKDNTGGILGYKSRTDSLEYGYKITDTGCRLVTGGVDTKMYPIVVASSLSDADVAAAPVGSIIMIGAVT